MKTKAAVIYEQWPLGRDFVKNNIIKIEELDLIGPKEGEVLVKVMGTGLCHSDLHLITGGFPIPMPIVLGHEACVIVEQLGPGCKRLKEGDHAIATWMPSCGKCHYCVNGMAAMCDSAGHSLMSGTMLDGTYRFFKGNQGIGQPLYIGTMSEYAVLHEDALVPIDKDFPLDVVGIVGCAVPTGWGAAVNTAKVTPGSTCLVIGCGGVGTSAIQGCRIAGASRIIAVDHNDKKLGMKAKFGATHTINNEKENVLEAIKNLTGGQGVDFAFEAIATQDTQRLVVDAIRKRGIAVFIGLHDASINTINANSMDLITYSKTIRGSLYGDCNMLTDIPRILQLYKSRQLLLDEMITKYYKLEDINQALDDLVEEKNIRGMVKF